MPKRFTHKALSLQRKKPIIFTALPKKYFYMRMFIVQFVLQKGKIPLNPFMSFDYFLSDMVNRDAIRNANNNLLRLADELWVFGSVSNGVMAEIQQAKKDGKPIKYFSIIDDKKIQEIKKTEVLFEDDMEKFKTEL